MIKHVPGKRFSLGKQKLKKTKGDDVFSATPPIKNHKQESYICRLGIPSETFTCLHKDILDSLMLIDLPRCMNAMAKLYLTLPPTPFEKNKLTFYFGISLISLAS